MKELSDANETLCVYIRRHFVAKMAKFRSLADEIRPGKRKKTRCAGEFRFALDLRMSSGQHFMTKYPNLTGLTGKELSDVNETLCV